MEANEDAKRKDSNERKTGQEKDIIWNKGVKETEKLQVVLAS